MSISRPAHKSFHISTTVDPSFVISLIRKLVPLDVKDCENALESCLHEEEPKSKGIEENAIGVFENGELQAKEAANNGGEENGPKTVNEKKHQGGLAREKTWEECGCILWDLSARGNHSRFMAQNLIIDVLLANLMVSQSARITEIIFGILGNLALHEISLEQISSSNGLVKLIVNQFFLDDVPLLCETFRVITTFVQNSDECDIWAEALQTEQTLSRIMWISENYLNRNLVKQIACFLCYALNHQEVAAILLPPMMKLGLSSLLINLLAFEMSKFREEQKHEGDKVLDYILISVATVMDDYSEEICFNKQLLQLLEELIKFPDKSEIPNACVHASRLLEKIVIDGTNLASEMSRDLDILQGLMDAFPFANGYLLEQASMWKFISMLLTLVRESEVATSFLNRLVSILTRKFDLLKEEIVVFLVDDMDDDTPPIEYVDALVIVIKIICCILTQWKLLDDETKKTASKEGNYINEEDVDKLLDICANAFIPFSPISRESCASCEEPPPPTHHPSEPSHKSFDIPTTVDPCFVITSKRKLVPSDVACDYDLLEEETKSEDTVENYGKSGPREKKKQLLKSNIRVGWLEKKHWKIVTSEDHAHLMVSSRLEPLFFFFFAFSSSVFFYTQTKQIRFLSKFFGDSHRRYLYFRNTFIISSRGKVKNLLKYHYLSEGGLPAD